MVNDALTLAELLHEIRDVDVAREPMVIKFLELIAADRETSG
jgi:hypothetical protein